jgi:hypothetical protein
VCGGTSRNLACLLLEGDSFEFGLFVDISGLEDMVRAVENNYRIAGDVCLQE